MTRIELQDFYNEGFGWVCRHCEREVREPETFGRPRYMREGEAENKNSALSTAALAKWLDKTQSTLICPRCGISESVDQA
jgi:hypothetical protein